MAAETIAIVGETGSGKTTSLRNLNPKETFIVSVTGKPLSFRGWKSKYKALHKNQDGKWEGNYYTSSNTDSIIKILTIVNKLMPHIKQVIVDDMQYIMSYEFMDRAGEKGYDKFTEMAQHVMTLLRYSETMREDCKMIFLTHSVNEGSEVNPRYVIKTLGKLLSEKVTLEGLFTYVFFTKIQEGDEGKMEYKFLTNTDGECSAKTPMGMFEERLIDNDLNEILRIIDEYNNAEE